MKFEEFNDLILHKGPVEKLKIPKGARVLDIGCGDGTLVNKLRGEGIDAVGIDYEPWEKNENIIRADAHFLPFKTETFDYVVSFLVIGHVKDEMKVMEEVSRVTRPDGKLMLAHIADSILNIRVRVWKGVGIPLQHYGIYKLYTFKEAERVVKKTGFKPVHIYSTNFAPPFLNIIPPELRNSFYSFLYKTDSRISKYFKKSGKNVVIIASKTASKKMSL